MPIQNVIFDLDGTLINSLPGIEQAYQEALSIVLPEVSVPDIKNLIGPPINKIFQLSLQLEDALLIETLVKEFKNQNTNLFIVTNKRIYPTRKILSHFGLDHLFTEIIAPDVCEPPFTSKKNALTFLMNKHQLQSKRTIFVGDSKDDIEAAVENDTYFVAADYGYGNISLNQDFTVAHAISYPKQLLTLINKIYLHD